MLHQFQQALTHRNGLVRKAAVSALRVPKWWHRLRARPADYRIAPPLFANSFPKSGTHLLFQIIHGLPNVVDYGAFLASLTSSFRFRPRSPESIRRMIRSLAPGEIMRGHLYYEPHFRAELARQNVVNYFVFRDPRDVVVSEAHYLRDMNRWHRLHRHFAAVPSMAEAISLSITGFDPPVEGLDYPNIAERFACYGGWLQTDECLGIRFEDLISDARPAVIRRMAEFYARHCDGVDIDSCAAQMAAGIAPEKSHTFRSGKKAGWAREFTPEHRQLFDRVAGQLLIDLGYESNHDWAAPEAATVT